MKTKHCFLFISISLAILTLIQINSNVSLPVRDTTYIVELKDVYGDSESARIKVEQEFKKELISNIGFNFRIKGGIKDLSNMVFLNINSKDSNVVKNLNYVSYLNKETTYKINSYDSGAKSFNPEQDTIAPDKNYSAEEMSVPNVGSKGKGTVIAVLDNSFQLDHEALKDLSSNYRLTKKDIETVKLSSSFFGKGDTYYNNKIPFYYDYADDDNLVKNPNENHGVHTSSLAAANGDNFKGIAPDAQLVLMKVFDDSSGTASESAILEALNDCVKLDVDVINMSLGFANNDDPADRAAEDGTIEDTFTASFRAMQYLENKGVVVSVSAGNEGKGNFIKDKVQTNDFGDYGENWSLDNVDNGILGSYANSKYATIVGSSRLSGDSSINNCSSYTKKVSGFSSEGSTYDLCLNPDIMTPGENCWGAVTYNNDTDVKYKYLSGTSMSAPNYAGVASYLLSSRSYSNDEEKTAFARTINSRLMSTAEPIEQLIGGYYTPRKEGAGVPNLTNAIDSKIYLEGVRNKAKIELKNNEDIKVGHIKFDVSTHNETSLDKTYKAKLIIEAPALSGDSKKESLFDKLLEEKTFDVSIPSGDSSFNVDFNISDETKEYLKNFENGTYLEGYVLLTPNDSADCELSIPYLGFYGDYGTAEPVEKFDFKKDKDKVYGSDLVNSLFQTKLSNLKADYSSDIVTTDSVVTDGIISKLQSNVLGIKDLGSESIIDSDGYLICGYKGLSRTLAIQQFVYRSINDNKIELINSNTNDVVYSGKLRYLSNDKQYVNDSGVLCKSLCQAVSSGTDYSCGRAFATIDLFDYVTGLPKYDYGTYILKFSYELAYGTTISKTIKIKFNEGEATNPNIGKKSYSDSTNSIIRINLDSNTTSVVVNYDEFDIKDENGQKYILVPISDYSKKGKFLLTVTNDFNLVTKQLVSLTDFDNLFSIQNSDLKATYDISMEDVISSDDSYTHTYTSKVLDARGNKVKIGEYQVCYRLPDGIKNDGDSIVVSEVDSNGNESTISFEVSDNCLVYKTSTGVVKVSYTKEDNKSSDSGNNIVLITCIIIGVVVIVGAVAFVIVLSKKKNKSKKVN